MNSKILCINTGKLFVDLAVGCACVLFHSEAQHHQGEHRRAFLGEQ